KYQKSEGDKHKQSPKIEEDETDDEPSSTRDESGDDNDDEEANEIGSDQEESGSDKEEDKDRKEEKEKPKKKKSNGNVSLKKDSGNKVTEKPRFLGYISDSHFDVDLLHRKAEVKAIIDDVINNMSDEEERDDGHPEAENDEDKNEGDDSDA
ncbi:hypothetical protein HAX54_020492, partial [Datura stramonium]|nr:hypothetical protein [Datura stramonium]